MIIREATAGDFEELFDVFESVAAEKRWIGQEAPVDRAWRISTWHEYLEVDGSVMLVAEDDGALVGMATLKKKGPADLGMLVDPGSRGQGVGAALLEACIDWAKRNGHYKISLQVWPTTLAPSRCTSATDSSAKATSASTGAVSPVRSGFGRHGPGARGLMVGVVPP